MRSTFWQERGDLIVGTFVMVFVGTFAVLLMLWLAAAVVLGTVELVRIIQ